jgi:hypothetical protein
VGYAAQLRALWESCQLRRRWLDPSSVSLCNANAEREELEGRPDIRENGTGERLALVQEYTIQDTRYKVPVQQVH